MQYAGNTQEGQGNQDTRVIMVTWEPKEKLVTQDPLDLLVQWERQDHRDPRELEVTKGTPD